jgi:hypothetical protein
VLSQFRWGDVQSELGRTLRGGGVLYISGYPKTYLWEDLLKYLEEFNKKNTLVCIDHGRLVLNLIDGRALDALRNAFVRGLIDIYICTFQEFLSFYCFQKGVTPQIRHQTVEGLLKQTSFAGSTIDVHAILDELALDAEFALPCITAVRDRNVPGETNVFVIIGGEVHLIESEEHVHEGPTSLRHANAFNAGMMHHLVHGYRTRSCELETLAIRAAREGLQRWHEADHRHWSDETGKDINNTEGV